jgi:alpha-N-acetylglucosamine transferase
MDEIHNLEKIIMKCPNEDDSYPDPPKPLNKDGSCKFAFVTLVMMGDLYVAGAINLAHSIRLAGSMMDIVVMVTPDVSDEAKKIMQSYFTHIVQVDFIHVKNWRVKRQPHRKYLEYVFTKMHMFNLTQYEKILFIDADALVLKYPDHLFTLQTPAGSLIEYKNSFITYDKNGEYILPKNNKIDWYTNYCDCCEHGKIMSKEITDRIKTQKKNSGIGAGLLLLTPRKGEMESIMDDVRRQPMKDLVENKLIWPEQQYLTLRYSGKWTSVNPRFYGLQGYPHWKMLYGLQYAGDKPFMSNSKLDIKVRMTFPDFLLWHDMYKDILIRHPTFLDSPVLEQANEMNKICNSAVKKQNRLMNRITDRMPKQITNRYKFKNIVSKLFNVKVHKINDDQLDYYYTFRGTEYVNPQQKPMFDDIKEYDFIEPIKRLNKYYGGDNYYAQLLSMYGDVYKYKNQPLGDQFPEDIDIIDKDAIMLEYIKCRPNMSIITLWPKATQNIKINKILEIVGDFVDIAYVKTVTLTKKALYNLMFWMYDEFVHDKRINFITKKIEYINSSDNNNVTFLFVDNVRNKKISGTRAEDKTKIRKLLMRQIDDDNDYGEDLIHINDFFHQTITYGQMILNENTRDMFNIQNIHNITNPLFNDSNLKIQTLKKWTSMNLSLLDANRLLIMSGACIYAHGFRKMGDIDALFVKSDNGESESDKEMGELLHRNFVNKNTKFYFSDVGVQGSNFWKDSWTQLNKLILEFFGNSSMAEIAFDPRYHFYFNGLKCYLLKYEIIRKIIRSRTNQYSKYKDYADFMIMSSLYKTISSQYVELKDGNLVFDNKLIDYLDYTELKNNDGKISFNHEELKKIITDMYKIYTRDDISKFKDMNKEDMSL